MIRVLHFSDTHGLHWTIEEDFPLPDGDIAVITGDFSDGGTDEQIADYVAWLQTISPRLHMILIIPGNHDWMYTVDAVACGILDPHEVVKTGFMHRKLETYGLPANCKVLDHEEVEVMGLRIWGSSWCPWQRFRCPDQVTPNDDGSKILFETWKQDWGHGATTPHRFGEIPLNIDILLTHGPAEGIMDYIGGPFSSPKSYWGASPALLEAIKKTKPRMHLFGHLHEQRGVWRKTASGFDGGIEYRVHPDYPPFPTPGPPPSDYPCELISCNAMKNHPRMEDRQACIAGPARLIEVAPMACLAQAIEESRNSSPVTDSSTQSTP